MNGCTAKMQINGYKFECEHSTPDHSGPHTSRVKVDQISYSGLDWDIDDTGIVVLIIPPDVAKVILGWQKREN